VLVASLAALALASVVWGLREGRRDAPALTVPQDAGAMTTSSPAPGPTAVGKAVPVELRVPAARIRMRVVPKGVRPDGQMALPPKPTVVGWYRFGAVPLGLGSTVLAAHVDSRRFGLGPLARLGGLEAGDELTVLLSDGRSVRYRTVAVRRIAKQSSALGAIFDRDGRSRLRVVTCGGPFDPDNGGYRDNVVLTAMPLARR
jgi:hypothetical protein